MKKGFRYLYLAVFGIMVSFSTIHAEDSALATLIQDKEVTCLPQVISVKSAVTKDVLNTDV